MDPKERERIYKEDRLNSVVGGRDGRPSVETAVYHVLKKFGFHPHSRWATSVLAAANYETAARKVFGKEVVVVDYLNPGILLAQAIQEKVNSHKGELHGAAQRSHGTWYTDDDPDKLLEIYARCEARAKREIARAMSTTGLDSEPFPNIGEDLLPRIEWRGIQNILHAFHKAVFDESSRGLTITQEQIDDYLPVYSLSSPVGTLHLNIEPIARQFACSTRSDELEGRVSNISPDHTIFCDVRDATVRLDHPEQMDGLAQNVLDQIDEKREVDGTLPRIYNIKGVGELVVAGHKEGEDNETTRNVKANVGALAINDVLHIDVQGRAIGNGKEIYRITYEEAVWLAHAWETEQFRMEQMSRGG